MIKEYMIKRIIKRNSKRNCEWQYVNHYYKNIIPAFGLLMNT